VAGGRDSWESWVFATDRLTERRPPPSTSRWDLERGFPRSTDRVDKLFHAALGY
jgi:hypothetical protein